MPVRHLIIGGGTAGMNAMRTIREEEREASEITLVSGRAALLADGAAVLPRQARSPRTTSTRPPAPTSAAGR